MKNMLIIIITFLFLTELNGQNIFRISENSDLTILAHVDSIQNNANEKIAYLKDKESNEQRILKFEDYRDFFGWKIPEHQIHVNDTLLVFANTQNDTLINRIAISKKAEFIYNSLVSFQNITLIPNKKKRLSELKKWFVSTSTNIGMKENLSGMMRNDKERDYFFLLAGISEDQLVFNKSEKKILTKSISESRCLKFEDFHVVYLMRYSYDKEFENNLKKIMSTYCIPFGDGHLHMMRTILFNKKNWELLDVYLRFKKVFIQIDDEAKKVYNEFIDKIDGK